MSFIFSAQKLDPPAAWNWNLGKWGPVGTPPKTQKVGILGGKALAPSENRLGGVWTFYGLPPKILLLSRKMNKVFALSRKMYKATLGKSDRNR